MARRLDHAPSTLVRELRRNTTARGRYGAMSAQACRALGQSSIPQASSRQYAVGRGAPLLDQKWSPEEISATRKRAFPDERATANVPRNHLQRHLRLSAR